MKFTGELAHDEIVLALVEFVKRNHPVPNVAPTDWHVERDGNGTLRASFSLEFPATAAKFDAKRTP